MRHEFNRDLVKVYTTFSEFVEKANDWSKAKERGGFSSTSKSYSGSDFYGDAEDFPTMYRRCYDGYGASTIMQGRADLSGLIDLEAAGDTLRHSGDDLDVPTYLSGEMRCFWAEDQDAKPPKRIHLVYASNCVAGVGAKSFANHGGAVCVIADALMELNAQVKVTCTFTNTYVFGDRKALQAIEIKDYSESVDVTRIGVTTHPSWFRRIGFGWFESFMQDVLPKSGYGHTTEYGCSRTGSERSKFVIGDEEFAEWLRIDADEIVVDLPAADLSLFESKEKTAEWVKSAVDRILTQSEESKYIKIWS
jgi:hypothetical protein